MGRNGVRGDTERVTAGSYEEQPCWRGEKALLKGVVKCLLCRTSWTE